MTSDRDDYQQDIGAALAEAIERSWSASKTTLKLRVWDVMREAGYDLPRLEETIAAEIEDERRRTGRQQPGPYNRPPKALERQFERIAKDVIAGPTQSGGHATVKYELQGPIERHGRADLTQAELEAIARFVANGIRATRGPKLVASLDSSGGGGTSAHGGVRDADRLAYTSHQLALSRLPREWWPVLHQLIEGGATTLAIGRWLLPSVRTEASLRVAGRAFLKVVATVLLDHEIKDRGLRNGGTSARNALNQIDRERRNRIA